MDDMDRAPGSDQADALRGRWHDCLVAARGGGEGPDPLPYADNLLARWAEPRASGCLCPCSP